MIYILRLMTLWIGCITLLLSVANPSQAEDSAELIGRFVIDVEASLDALSEEQKTQTRFNPTTRYQFHEDHTWNNSIIIRNREIVVEGTWRDIGDGFELQSKTLNGEPYSGTPTRVYRDGSYWVHEVRVGGLMLRSYLKPLEH